MSSSVLYNPPSARCGYIDQDIPCMRSFTVMHRIIAADPELVGHSEKTVVKIIGQELKAVLRPRGKIRAVASFPNPIFDIPECQVRSILIDHGNPDTPAAIVYIFRGDIYVITEIVFRLQLYRGFPGDSGPKYWRGTRVGSSPYFLATLPRRRPQPGGISAGSFRSSH
jgi:hypothetical protein